MWLDINFVIIQTKLKGIADKITYKSKRNYFYKHDRGRVILIHRAVTKLNRVKSYELSAGTVGWDSRKSKTQMCYRSAVLKNFLFHWRRTLSIKLLVSYLKLNGDRTLSRMCPSKVSENLWNRFSSRFSQVMMITTRSTCYHECFQKQLSKGFL